MLYFFKAEDQLGQFIGTKLEEMSAASRVITVDEGESYLSEYEKDFKGFESIKEFLDHYAQLLNGQHMVSADACFVDPTSDDSSCTI
ncbi:MAG: hypothetical protein AAFO69_08065 [Bacteroidota bacterium]